MKKFVCLPKLTALQGSANPAYYFYLEISFLTDTCCYQSPVTQIANIEWHDQGKCPAFSNHAQGTEKSYLTATSTPQVPHDLRVFICFVRIVTSAQLSRVVEEAIRRLVRSQGT